MQGLAFTTGHKPQATGSPVEYRQLGLRLQYVHTADAIWELAGRLPTVLSIHYGALAQLIGAASSDTGRRHLEHVAAAGVVRIIERRRGLAIVEVYCPERALLNWRARLAPPPADKQLELFEKRFLAKPAEDAKQGNEREPVGAQPLRSLRLGEKLLFGEQTRKFPASCGEAAENVRPEPPPREVDREREKFFKLMEVRRQQDPACRPAGPVPMIGEAIGAQPANVHVSSKETSKTYTCHHGGTEMRRGATGSGSDAPQIPASPCLPASAAKQEALSVVEKTAAVLPSDAQIVDGKQAELERAARAASILPSVYRKVTKQAVQGRLPFDELLDVCAQANAIERGGGKFTKSRGAYIVGGFRQVYRRHGVAWFRQTQPPVKQTV